jgi:hypothetical protein
LWIYNLNFIIHGKDQSKENMFIYTKADNLPGKNSNEVFPIYLLLVREEKDIDEQNLTLCGFSTKTFLGRTTPTLFLVVALSIL